MQVNWDCCEFSDLLSFALPPVSGAPEGETGGGSVVAGSQIHQGDLVIDAASGTKDNHVARLWSDEDDRYLTAEELVDAIDEHRQGSVNLLQDERDERTISAAAGDQLVDPYPLIDLDRVGIADGDPGSLRIEAKAEA